MTDNQLFLITGIFVLVCSIFVVLLDRRSKKKGPIHFGQISLPLRIICFILGIIWGGFTLMGIWFAGKFSPLDAVISVILLVCAFFPQSKKEPSQEILPDATMPTSPESSADPYNFGNSQLVEDFHNKNSNSILRIGIYILIFGIFLLIVGGVWYLSKQTLNLGDFEVWIVLVIILMGQIGGIFSLYHFGKLLSRVSKNGEKPDK
jgi:hypothetical protein